MRGREGLVFFGVTAFAGMVTMLISKEKVAELAIQVRNAFLLPFLLPAFPPSLCICHRRGGGRREGEEEEEGEGKDEVLFDVAVVHVEVPAVRINREKGSMVGREVTEGGGERGKEG